MYIIIHRNIPLSLRIGKFRTGVSLSGELLTIHGIRGGEDAVPHTNSIAHAFEGYHQHTVPLKGVYSSGGIFFSPSCIWNFRRAASGISGAGSGKSPKRNGISLRSVNPDALCPHGQPLYKNEMQRPMIYVPIFRTGMGKQGRPTPQLLLQAGCDGSEEGESHGFDPSKLPILPFYIVCRTSLLYSDLQHMP